MGLQKDKNRIKSINTGWFRYLVVTLILLIICWTGVNFYQSGLQLFHLIALLWIVTVIIFLWFGNKFIFNFLDSRWSWLTHTSRRFFLQLLISCFYSLICINGTYYLFKIQTTLTTPDLAQVFVLNVYGLLFMIPVLSVNFSVYFMMQWKKAHTQSNELKEENLRTQLNSLRMQLDPHFLFNNLNVLSSLIERDPKIAQHFLDKFADVYRYVLEYKREELVAVNVELEFIEAYVYLLKKRFGEQLKIEIDIPSTLPDTLFIPPLSLQLLIENALKHNKISDKNPLFIHVFIQDESWLTVRNTYNPRQEETLRTSKTGLENIHKRYEYLSSLNIKIHQDASFFTVSLPLLEVTE